MPGATSAVTLHLTPAQLPTRYPSISHFKTSLLQPLPNFWASSGARNFTLAASPWTRQNYKREAHMWSSWCEAYQGVCAWLWADLLASVESPLGQLSSLNASPITSSSPRATEWARPRQKGVGRVRTWDFCAMWHKETVTILVVTSTFLESTVVICVQRFEILEALSSWNSIKYLY